MNELKKKKKKKKKKKEFYTFQYIPIFYIIFYNMNI